VREQRQKDEGRNMLAEGRSRDMLSELFKVCGRFLHKEISLETFAEKTERLAKEKLRAEGRIKQTHS